MKANIPFLADTDILIFGSTSAAVSAAITARKAGKRVTVVSSFTYPGEDVCSKMNYSNWGAYGETAPFATDVFKKTEEGDAFPTPMQVKLALETPMLENDVKIIYMSYPVAILKNEDGDVSGAIIANRSGFQAIRTSIIIDATSRALAARLANENDFSKLKPRKYRCYRKAAGNRSADIAREPGKRISGFFRKDQRDYIPYYWEFKQTFNDTKPKDFGTADIKTRILSWYPGQLISSDVLDTMLVDKLISNVGTQKNVDVESFNLQAMLCGSSIFVLSPMADICRGVTNIFRDPCAAMVLGQKLGEYIVSLVKDVSGKLTVVQDNDAIEGVDVVKMNKWFRATENETIEMDLNKLPLLGEYDVVIAGGGTAGAPAGISAGRAGAKTLILEYTSSLGGVSTEGRIASYYHGNRCGFSNEIDAGIHDLGANPEFDSKSNVWNTEWKKQWYLRSADDAGVDIWFNSLVPAAAVKDDKVCGVVVATPYGYGLVKAKSVVDATGNSDVVAAAGGSVVNIEKEHLAVQGTGLSPYDPGWHYQNTDHTFIDDTDIVDISRAFAVSRHRMANSFDLSQIVNSRQRQQIVGEVSMDPLDFLAHRTFPDTITTASSNFDTHGYTIHPVFMAKAPDEEELMAHIPFRCLLPVGLEGIMSTGLGVCSHRDALPVIRMQPDVQNQGYAAGRAAAMSALGNCDLRKIDMKELQKHLIEKKILNPEVLEHKDSFPLSDEMVAEAVANGTDDYLGLAVIFGSSERSLPLMQKAFEKAEGDAKIRYAHLLGLMGDDTGAEELADYLDSKNWDQGWNYRGMGQFGFSLSEIDTQLVALGRSDCPRAKKTLLAKLDKASADSDFSHLRALTIAFEAQPTEEAVKGLTRILTTLKPSAQDNVAENVKNTSNNWCEVIERNNELKELLVARGLLACGDPKGLAKDVLTQYSNDLHGHYARHAKALLNNG
jgi:ribulose 1,5-bisphosphate synthetase/thiazole synthase